MSSDVGYNHYRPARYFAEQSGKVNPPTAVPDRFEQIFKEVNGRLIRNG